MPFELKESDKLIGLNNEAGIIDFCIETVERNQPCLEKKAQSRIAING